MNTIRQLCDRCIVLDKGKVIFEGDVEQAINVYMYDEAKNLGVDIDLSNNRMTHLPKKAIGKITHLTLLDKESAVYEFDEHIRMSLDIKANEELSDLSLRVEMRSLSGNSVGVTMINDFATIPKGEIQFLILIWILKGLLQVNTLYALSCMLRMSRELM